MYHWLLLDLLVHYKILCTHIYYIIPIKMPVCSNTVSSIVSQGLSPVVRPYWILQCGMKRKYAELICKLKVLFCVLNIYCTTWGTHTVYAPINVKPHPPVRAALGFIWRDLKLKMHPKGWGIWTSSTQWLPSCVKSFHVSNPFISPCHRVGYICGGLT